jgi:hypothetical protein
MTVIRRLRVVNRPMPLTRVLCVYSVTVRYGMSTEAYESAVMVYVPTAFAIDAAFGLETMKLRDAWKNNGWRGQPIAFELLAYLPENGKQFF